MGPTWGPIGADRYQVGPMLSSWTLLSGGILFTYVTMRKWYLQHDKKKQNHVKLFYLTITTIHLFFSNIAKRRVLTFMAGISRIRFSLNVIHHHLAPRRSSRWIRDCFILIDKIWPFRYCANDIITAYHSEYESSMIYLAVMWYFKHRALNSYIVGAVMIR